MVVFFIPVFAILSHLIVSIIIIILQIIILILQTNLLVVEKGDEQDVLSSKNFGKLKTMA